ncbi:MULTISPECIES: helix-turn-helix transcriptional regulator [Bacteroidales]|mgnify:FL=1|uniref:helix-turn-helix domain-containing protein n=1 Tax=Bacteroidales TaxID=171549 RepID=UPI0025F5E8D7|nr:MULTISPECIES: helix-turn-helix transcriptional regulator [Bacteroidales]
MDNDFRIAEILKSRGMTQTDLAEKMGISRVGLSKAINGNTTITTLRKIAVALGVDVVELFAKKGDFVAFVRRDGVTHTFDTEDALIDYAEELKADKGARG